MNQVSAAQHSGEPRSPKSADSLNTFPKPSPAFLAAAVLQPETLNEDKGWPNPNPQAVAPEALYYTRLYHTVLCHILLCHVILLFRTSFQAVSAAQEDLQ